MCLDWHSSRISSHQAMPLKGTLSERMGAARFHVAPLVTKVQAVTEMSTWSNSILKTIYHATGTFGCTAVAISEAPATMPNSRDTSASPVLSAGGPEKQVELFPVTSKHSLSDSKKPKKKRRKRSSKVRSSSYGLPSDRLSSPIKAILWWDLRTLLGSCEIVTRVPLNGHLSGMFSPPCWNHDLSLVICGESIHQTVIFKRHITKIGGALRMTEGRWPYVVCIMQGRFIDEISIAEVMTYSHLPSKLAAEQLGIGTFGVIPI